MRRRFAVLGLIALAVAAFVSRRKRRVPARGTAFAPRAEPLALPAAPRFVSVPWTLADPATDASADEPELAIRYERSEHMALDRVDVQETPTQVFVTVLVRWQPPAGARAGAPNLTTDATASLSRPLGDRELIHAPTDLDEPDAPPLYP